MTEIAARLDLDVDISGKVGIEGSLHTAVTVHLPRREIMPARPIVMFAFPGGGAGRGMWCMEAPDTLEYSQARWHAERGIIFVSCDHLGTGGSSHPDPQLLASPYPLAWANQATVEGVLELLATDGAVAGYGAVTDPVRISIGHSMGANLTIVLQAHRQVFDGVGILGYSAIHTALPVPHGIDPRPHPRPPRANPDVRTFGVPDDTRKAIFRHMNRWDAQEAAEMRRHQWRLPIASETMPPAAMYMNAAGVVLEEASWIEVPVFLGFGERDVTRNPWEEPRWYWRARDIELAVVPRMSHGLNSAATRGELWRRLHHWALGVGDARDDAPLAPA
jgi:alpha-beta hydrolase superfamily lysophospholipase